MFLSTRELINQRSVQTIILCFVSMVLCQTLKFILMSIKERRLLWKALFTTGGTPSSHTSTVITLVLSLGIFQIHDDNMIDYSFAVALAISAIVIHDAMGVRLETSKHAKILNNMVENEPDETKIDLGFGKKTKLKELVGHKPLEVFYGFLFGILIAVVGCSLFI